MGLGFKAKILRQVTIQNYGRVQYYSRGDTARKIAAIELIFSQRKHLPSQSIDLALRLAGLDQPTEVRLAVAKSFAKAELSQQEYVSFLGILVNDPNPEVSGIIKDILNKKTGFFSLLDFFKAYQQILFQRTKDSMTNRSEQISGRSFSFFVDNFRELNIESSKALLNPTTSYYPVLDQDIYTIENAGLSPNSRGYVLSQRLSKCKPGREQWIKYQDICKEIMTHCFFWNYIMIKFGLAIIVECKNYSHPLKENEFLLSSKYLDRKGLTKLGIVVTRIGMHENAKPRQIKEWGDNEKMMVCLADKDLTNMIKLKEA